MKATIRTDNLDVDERRRIEQHEQVKEQVRDKVHHELGERAAADAPTDQEGVEGLARDMKRRAVREVSASEAELERVRKLQREYLEQDRRECLAKLRVWLEHGGETIN